MSETSKRILLEGLATAPLGGTHGYRNYLLEDGLVDYLPSVCLTPAKPNLDSGTRIRIVARLHNILVMRDGRPGFVEGTPGHLSFVGGVLVLDDMMESGQTE